MSVSAGEIVPGVYRVDVPFPLGLFPPDAPPATICYLVRQAGGWLMIDSGLHHPSCYDALCNQLSALRIPISDIRWLLITHFHPDHFGLAGRIKAASKAEVIMHRKDWEVVKFIMDSAQSPSEDEMTKWAGSMGITASEMDGLRQVVSFGVMLFSYVSEPDLLLEEDEHVVGDTGWLQAIRTPGHTPGHICVYDRSNRVLFAGDHVLTGITTHVTPGILSTDDQLSEYLRALRKVQQLDVKMVLPAHEQPFANLSQRVEELLGHHERRLQQVLEPLRRRCLSAREVASQVEWMVGQWDRMDGMNRLLAIQETLAHLRLLQEQGRITVVEKEGVSLFQASVA
jgi:glyoxylase-like metal-dependent hydrolase (beta-lactamase superfamily II)